MFFITIERLWKSSHKVCIFCAEIVKNLCSCFWTYFVQRPWTTASEKKISSWYFLCLSSKEIPDRTCQHNRIALGYGSMSQAIIFNMFFIVIFDTWHLARITLLLNHQRCYEKSSVHFVQLLLNIFCAETVSDCFWKKNVQLIFLCWIKCVAASANISMFFKERAAASEMILRKNDCFWNLLKEKMCFLELYPLKKWSAETRCFCVFLVELLWWKSSYRKNSRCCEKHRSPFSYG